MCSSDLFLQQLSQLMGPRVVVFLPENTVYHIQTSETRPLVENEMQ